MREDLLFTPPDFSDEKYASSKDVTTAEVVKDGVSPQGFYLTSHAPTYYKVDGKWQIPERSSQDCLAVLEDGKIYVREFRNLKKGDKVVIADTNDGSQGVLKYAEGFSDEVLARGGDFVEASNTSNYRLLYELMKKERDAKGMITWVLGPAVVFDFDTRNGLSRLAENGYVQALLGGNAMATHDLEGGYLNTALGQDIYTQISDPLGHYNHLDTLNAIRNVGSIDEFINQGNVRDGFVKTLNRLGVPITLAGSIRDDGPLPEVTGNVYESLDNVRKQTDKSNLIICLATTLHSASTAETASSYRIDEDGNVVPVFIFTVDVTENAVRKVSAAREGIAVRTLVTNVQDFVVNLEKELVPEEFVSFDEEHVYDVEEAEVSAEASDEKEIKE
ncbi:hypothetical protein [Anaerococcus sp.]|uniref:ornithine cyclodeaminase family domain n=1 Tax=Anaerococcus sp. TaxID=1872515 RepID=UPI002A75CFF9|nr:hypothetical protein [Anaerococcus sp.]MDY2927784.1 hypothetical protein [Anaerococcus sp.]